MQTTDIGILMDWRIWHVWWSYATWLDGGNEFALEVAQWADEEKVFQFNRR